MGRLYLARRRYEDAIEQYQAALQSNDGKGWYFELGLAYLLAGRFEEARIAYEQGLVDEDRVYGLRELDHWVSQQPDRVDFERCSTVPGRHPGFVG